MKYRKDFVTNSSSSSFVCDICGASESGYDFSLSDAEMVQCVNGHTICQNEMLTEPRDAIIKKMLSFYEEHHEWFLENGNIYTEEELNAMCDGDLLSTYISIYEHREAVIEECCPICQFIEYSTFDFAKFLKKEYKVSREEVFAEIKRYNKRRKKLYNSEYITEVCKRFDLNPATMIPNLKERFGTYRAYLDYINS